MTSYSDALKVHLTSYKHERLGVAENGVWRGNDKSYGHILPELLQKLNIIETFRREFWTFHELNKATVGLHTDFHHLNSSQAFTFNLFFPWMASTNTQAELMTALGVGERAIKQWHFEHMPDQSERTSVDFFAEFADGGRLFIEVKLTEAHFGAAMADEAHQNKLRDTYTKRLAGKVTSSALEEEHFFPNYQLFRNVSHLDLGKRDALLLLLPRANKLTWDQGVSFRDEYLSEHCQGAVGLVATEDLLTALAKSESHRRRTHAALLAEKYLLDTISGALR